MPYGAHALVALQGDWASSDGANEVWQFGVRVTEGSGGGFLQDPQGYCGALATPISTWFAAATSGMSAFARLRMLKVNNINPDGSYADPVTHLHDYGAGVTGGVPAVQDHVLSLAYSWTTNAVSRGPGARGRVYPPNPTYTLNGAFTVTNADVDKALAAAKALLNAIGAAPTGGDLDHAAFPCIASKTDGTRHPINNVSVDSVYDVQRRRKNRLTAVRHSSVWPT